MRKAKELKFMVVCKLQDGDVAPVILFAKDVEELEKKIPKVVKGIKEVISIECYSKDPVDEVKFKFANTFGYTQCALKSNSLTSIFWSSRSKAAM
jgi:hypothetical protein